MCLVSVLRLNLNIFNLSSVLFLRPDSLTLCMRLDEIRFMLLFVISIWLVSV